MCVSELSWSVPSSPVHIYSTCRLEPLLARRMQRDKLNRRASTGTHLYGLVPEGGVREIVPVDLIGCGVYVDGSHYLDRYATLWRKKDYRL